MTSPAVHPLQALPAAPARAAAVPPALRGWRLPAAGLALVTLGAAAGHWALPQRGEAGAPAPVATRVAQADTQAVATSLPAAHQTPNQAPSQAAPRSPAKPHPVQAQGGPATTATTARTNTPVDASGTAGTPAPRTWPTQPVVASTPRCADCGVVEAVTPVRREGQASGVGAVAGTVLGGVLGHQIGGGSGRKLMTVIGAVGGGLAGHEIEKRQRATTDYRVTLRMADGSERSLTQATPPSVGQWVRISGGQLRPLREDGAGRSGQATDAVDAVPVQAPAAREPGWQSS